MIYFKCNILFALKNKGYTSYKLLNKKILPAGTITKIRNNEAEKLSLATIDKICALLGCQPGDILEYVPDDSTAELAAMAAASPQKADNIGGQDRDRSDI